MTYLVYLYVRASYAVHRRLHGACEDREIRAFHTGYLRAIQDEQSMVARASAEARVNATLERQLRDVIARSGW